jgi:hypothetical protein
MTIATNMIHFDTLQYVKTLEASGIPSIQAEALAKAQQEALSESLNTSFATKEDILLLKEDVSQLKTDISQLNTEVKTEGFWIRWVLGLNSAGIGTLVLKAFF